jgi:anionic cell wall polymer biosynthesis LytR-Cps2A-Psr (LCP) family protein
MGSKPRFRNWRFSAISDYGRQVLSYKGENYALREDLETVLLLGVDKYVTETGVESYNNTQQADFLMLIIFDRTNKSYTALQLNRDTMTEITMLGVRGEQAGVFTGQLALAHTYGSGGKDSCRNTVDAVSNLLYGIDIDHYVAVTMDAVPIITIYPAVCRSRYWLILQLSIPK